MVSEGVSSPGTTAPAVKYSFGQSSIKGEDVVVVLPRNPWPHINRNESTSGGEDAPSDKATPYDDFALFCVFDGHNGVLAAKYVSDNLLTRLVEKLPSGRPPEENTDAFRRWREGIGRALSEVLSEIHLSFAKLGQLAGCTVTIVLQTGWLVTCANLGDSRAIVDTGVESVQLTVDHRVATNQPERRRVEGNGALIAPVCATGMGPAKDVNNGVGPLRIWPGGVCLSRGIGDFDVGNVIIPWPQVSQVRIPSSGARITVASDGVWDAFEHTSRVFKLSRSWPADTVPQRMISAIVRAHGGLRDDTSLIIIDVMPPGRDFTQNAKSFSVSHAMKSKWFCFKKPAVKEPQEEFVIGKVEWLVNQDVAQVLGQMPTKPSEQAVWATNEVVNLLLCNHALATETWRKAASEGELSVTPRASMNPPGETTVSAGDMSVHAGRVPARTPGALTPAADFSVHAGAPARPVAPADFSVHAGAVMKKRLAVAAAKGEQQKKFTPGDASVRFGRNVATTDEEYAKQFGHYSSLDKSSSSVDGITQALKRASVGVINRVSSSKEKDTASEQKTIPILYGASKEKKPGAQSSPVVEATPEMTKDTTL